MSAGSRPTGFVHPKAISLLERKSIAVEGLYSKSWNQLPALPDVVISVCDDAAGEECPLYLNSALRSHWGVSDPAKVVGEEKVVEAAFERAYDLLRFRIEALLAFFHSGQMGSHELLKKELDRIGTLMV
jgi:arsenate reductase